MTKKFQLPTLTIVLPTESPLSGYRFSEPEDACEVGPSTNLVLTGINTFTLNLFDKPNESQVENETVPQIIEYMGNCAGLPHAKGILEQRDKFPFEWRDFYALFPNTLWRDLFGLLIPALFWHPHENTLAPIWIRPNQLSPGCRIVTVNLNE